MHTLSNMQVHRHTHTRMPLNDPHRQHHNRNVVVCDGSFGDLSAHIAARTDAGNNSLQAEGEEHSWVSD